MTGGQFSPLTPFGKRATTATYGSVDRAFDLCELAKGAGATFVARGDVWQAQKITDLIVAGAQHKGFASIEIIATCPTSFGRYNKIPNPADMLAHIKQTTVSAERAAKMKPEELAGKLVTGILHREEAVEYNEGYQALVDSLQKKGGE
ncbi:MAG: thiamine pyrophosphate-dependent enzyme, partial [Clostridiales bacterium]|nr:thiamine pyrophosphate-dependent enzyme [Clostridiales bacterium]